MTMPATRPSASASGSFSMRCRCSSASASAGAMPGSPVTRRSSGVMCSATVRRACARAHVARRQDADQAAVGVDHEQARDAEPLGLGARLREARIRRHRVRVGDHARAEALDARDLGDLVGDREEAVHDAEAAELRQRDRHRRRRDRVHVGREHRDLERDPARQLRARRDVAARAQARAARHEQHVVERQREGQLLHQRPSVGYGSLPMATASLSTHVLDTGAGRPAPGVAVELAHEGRADRVGARPTTTGAPGSATTSRPVATGSRSRRPRRSSAASSSRSSWREGHYHVPLLVSAYSCASYRGS